MLHFETPDVNYDIDICAISIYIKQTKIVCLNLIGCNPKFYF